MSVHLIFEFLTAFVGTIAFALLFQVPKEYYVNCGLAGGCGWICYKLLLAGCGLFGSTFFATVLVVFLSRLSAVRRHWRSCLASCLSLNFHKNGFAGRSAVRLPVTDPHTGLFQLQSPTTDTESRYIQQCSTHLM